MVYNSEFEWEKIEKESTNLIRSLTILSGTIFGSSIALATGRTVNLRFVLGEFSLFLALVFGVLTLHFSLKGKEFFHFLMTTSNLKFSMPKRTGGQDDFIVEAQEKILKQYEVLLEKSKKDFLTPILKIIKVDYFYYLFIITFIIGVFLVFFSLVDLISLSNFIFDP